MKIIDKHNIENDNFIESGENLYEKHVIIKHFFIFIIYLYFSSIREL